MKIQSNRYVYLISISTCQRLPKVIVPYYSYLVCLTESFFYFDSRIFDSPENTLALTVVFHILFYYGLLHCISKHVTHTCVQDA